MKFLVFKNLIEIYFTDILQNNALLNSSSKEVINFNNVLNRIINEKI